MSTRNKRWKVRDLRRRLQELGCVPLRMASSHEIWQSPMGVSLPAIVSKYQNEEIHVQSLKRALEKEGIEL